MWYACDNVACLRRGPMMVTLDNEDVAWFAPVCVVTMWHGEYLRSGCQAVVNLILLCFLKDDCPGCLLTLSCQFMWMGCPVQ